MEKKEESFAGIKSKNCRESRPRLPKKIHAAVNGKRCLTLRKEILLLTFSDGEQSNGDDEDRL